MNFLVVERDGNLIGCGELRNYKKYSVLVNVFVQQKYRQQKIGSCLVEYISYEAKKPLYLCCYNELIPFYTRFGFMVISRQQVPMELQNELNLNSNLPIIPLVLLKNV
ncbi:MAG: GNAT family N-acetyltransferase [Calothrix sp. SM1_7_51]|nr:GNAT family N-acetyltransferase [Calothrix sp. SM1_7_51]